MKGTIRLLIVLVLVSIGGLAYWRHGDQWFAKTPEPQKPAPIRLVEEQQRCFRTHVYDDGYTVTQHRWIAHAVLNLSEQNGQSICRIFQRKVALAAPSEEPEMYSRTVEWTEVLENRMPFWGDPENRAKGEIEADRVLKERTADYAKEPCLKFVTRYIRPTKFGTIQDENKFKQELEFLYDEGKARFYGPKGTTC